MVFGEMSRACANCSETKSTPWLLPVLGFLVVGALRKYWRRNTRHVEYVIDQIRVALKRAGRELKGPSPFKQEKTPSFFVWFDFSSGQNGDILRRACWVRGMQAEGRTTLSYHDRIPRTRYCRLVHNSGAKLISPATATASCELIELFNSYFRPCSAPSSTAGGSSGWQATVSNPRRSHTSWARRGAWSTGASRAPWGRQQL
jgi:CHC2 zinc finger